MSNLREKSCSSPSNISLNPNKAGLNPIKTCSRPSTPYSNPLKSGSKPNSPCSVSTKSCWNRTKTHLNPPETNVTKDKIYVQNQQNKQSPSKTGSNPTKTCSSLCKTWLKLSPNLCVPCPLRCRGRGRSRVSENDPCRDAHLWKSLRRKSHQRHRGLLRVLSRWHQRPCFPPPGQKQSTGKRSQQPTVKDFQDNCEEKAC